MRKVKSTEQIRVIEHIEAVYCDKCGDKIDTSTSVYEYGWFKATFGHGSEDGGNGETYSMDLCEKCSKKLLDKLKELGYNIIIKEFDW